MKKTQIINIPVSSEEKRKIEKKAEALGLSVSAFVRYVCLRGKIKSSIEIV